jgi:nitrite transporter NirC
MFQNEINTIGEAAVKKGNLLNSGKIKYMLSSALAGMYVGLGILFIFTIGGILNTANSPATKIVMGASFGIALSLVIMAGSELFTGNNLVMTIGSLEKKTSWGMSAKIWLFSFIGNLLGSIVLGLLFVYSGLGNGHTYEFINKIAAVKMHAPFGQLIVRGILCNILVCLAVWSSFKLKSESAKLIMIFWCLFAFITSGFEHSVANMTLLSIALMIPHPVTITMSGFIYNLSAVTIGNFIGGAVFVGAAYWYISKPKI